MKRSILLAEHLTITLTVLSILLALIFLSFSLVQNILTNPNRYFNTNLPPSEVQFLVVHILIIVACVLLSYIIYLLLSSRSRTELSILNATRSLAVSREQFIKLYEDAPVPHITLNKDGEIRNPNKAALRFFGVVEEEIEGKNLFYYLPKEELEKAEKLFRYYKANIPINREEVQMITKNGTTKWALLSVLEMREFGSSERTGLATIFDITEQKKLDRAKTEFVSLASHQLRTPVSTIKWYMDMLLSEELGGLTPKQTDYINRVYKVNEEMKGLVDTLLNISRMEIGSIRVENKPTNTIELIDSVLMELSAQIESKNIIINKQYGDNLKNIESDPKLLRIVIQNLLSNAVKYTLPAGTVTVTLEDSFGEKTITVSDTGIGIPESQQEKIFTKMFRADNANTLAGTQGTGLGLYLVKSIVETMGGNIRFTSVENKGSSFVIKL